MAQRGFWTLNQLLVLALTAGFAALVLDLRSEHIDVVRKHWTPWIPIGYSGLMVVVGAVGLASWARGGRQLLLAAFATAFVVGGLGFWLHNDGHPLSVVGNMLAAWTQPLHHAKGPPQLAPLAFVGLGLLGLLACARRWQPTAGPAPQMTVSRHQDEPVRAG